MLCFTALCRLINLPLTSPYLWTVHRKHKGNARAIFMGCTRPYIMKSPYHALAFEMMQHMTFHGIAPGSAGRGNMPAEQKQAVRHRAHKMHAVGCHGPTIGSLQLEDVSRCHEGLVQPLRLGDLRQPVGGLEPLAKGGMVSHLLGDLQVLLEGALLNTTARGSSKQALQNATNARNIKQLCWKPPNCSQAQG